ncbi:gp205 [Mycobacterium phage Omega]|uniref:Uncharacterized protein n=1 Tax=Mycobacterium phage Omega TaxID=2907835 RepID=Q853W1_BPMOM|nr:gp205 [Mycobacterium phage Omega]AAN12847.1 hypothetical protein PBI_OMEGA_205 [Mycobacterium phage Omega]
MPPDGNRTAPDTGTHERESYQCRNTVYCTWDCASGCIWNLEAIESVEAE